MKRPKKKPNETPSQKVFLLPKERPVVRKKAVGSSYIRIKK